MHQVQNDSALSNEQGRHRDLKYYLSKGSASSKQIDRMADELEKRIIPTLRITVPYQDKQNVV